MPSLTDGVVVLREFVAGDAVALAAIWSDPSTLRASYLTPAGQALDQHVFGLLPEDLAGRPGVRGSRPVMASAPFRRARWSRTARSGSPADAGRRAGRG